jgi:hypothetical protein
VNAIYKENYKLLKKEIEGRDSKMASRGRKQKASLL